MKKKYPVLLLVFLLSGTLFSALHAQLAVRPGIKAGVNLGAFGSSTGFRAGPQLGVTTQFDFNEEGTISYILQPELQYTARGGKFDNTVTRMNYLELPIMSSVHFGAFYLEAGPQLGYLLSAREQSPEGKTNVKNAYRKVDFSINGGLGCRFRDGFGFGLRSSYGMVPTEKGSNSSFGDSH